MVNSTNLDYSNLDVQNGLCGGQGCNADSLQAQVKLWSLQSNTTYVATPSQSWVDDYVSWLEHCCSMDEATGVFCNETMKSAGGGGSDEDYYGGYGDYGEYGDYDPNNPDDDGGGQDSDSGPSFLCVKCMDRHKTTRPDKDTFYRWD